MIVDEQVRTTLEERYSFREWNGQRRLDEDLFIWKFFLSGREFRGWEPRHVRLLEPEEEDGWPHATANFIAVGEGPRPALNVTVYECSSQLAAHDLLLELLAGFELPRVERVDEEGIGDVAFSTPTETVVLFARGNLVASVKNASREAVNVKPFARALDDYLIAEPDETDEALAPHVELSGEVPTAPPEHALPLPLLVRAGEAVGQRVWYKFFSRSGSVRQRAGKAFYRAAEEAPAGTHQIRAYAVAPGAGIGGRTFSLGPVAATPDPE